MESCEQAKTAILKLVDNQVQHTVKVQVIVFIDKKSKDDCIVYFSIRKRKFNWLLHCLLYLDKLSHCHTPSNNYTIRSRLWDLRVAYVFFMLSTPVCAFVYEKLSKGLKIAKNEILYFHMIFLPIYLQINH